MEQSSNSRRWQIATDEKDPFPGVLGEAYTIDPGRKRHGRFEIYDDFDRSLTRKGLALLRERGRFRIAQGADLISNTVEGEVRRSKKPVFWWDFGSGPFRSLLKANLKCRAAVSIASVDLRFEELRIRNKDRKIVARLWREVARLGDDVASASLVLIPLLGYDQEADMIADSIAKSSDFSEEQSTLAARILQAAGKDRPPLSPKSTIMLNPRDTAQQAVAAIAQFMIKVARQNEAGVIEDVDTEFLHDYRVSIRKLRSVLALVKGVFPKEETRRLKAVFGDMARVTNPLRDLDVYLLDENSYRERLPRTLQSGLDRLFADFRKARARELGRVRRHLRSKEYDEEMRSQEAWFAVPELPKGPRADLSVGKLAFEEIHRHYRLVRKLGRRLNGDTSDAEVHKLRIECKKLRYLLELFESLLPSGEIKLIRRRLKGLQDVLGQFNDFVVQQAAMNRYLMEAKNLDKLSAAAVGGLIAMMRQGHREGRASIAHQFDLFNQPEMKKRFKHLFSRKEDEAE